MVEALIVLDYSILVVNRQGSTTIERNIALYMSWRLSWGPPYVSKIADSTELPIPRNLPIPRGNRQFLPYVSK